jgi:hypothetical protein
MNVTAQLEMFDPRGATEVSQLHAPRLDSLDGKTIAFLSNDMWQAHRSLPLLADLISKSRRNVVVIPATEFARGNSNIDSESIVEALRARGVDAVIVGNAACGACATACGRAAARIESAGIPTAILTRDTFANVTRNAVASLGFSQEAPVVTFPFDVFVAGGDLSPVKDSVEAFVDNLTRWRPAAREAGINEPARVNIEASDGFSALLEANRWLLTNLCGDGLPLYPPTEPLVRWILRGTDLSADHVLGQVMPCGGIATMETVAVSLAMAGGRPEYLPFLIAALEAILDPAMEHEKAQANSGSPFPVVIVNGPAARQIRLNSGFGLLGPDPRHPAGASIGRALRLLLQNVGGALPGQGTMAAYGCMRYTNAVFAEDETSLPREWQHLSADYDIPSGTDSVTVFAAVGGVSIPRRAISPDDLETEIVNGLHRIAAYMRTPSRDYVVGWSRGTPGALLISPIVAAQLAKLGWSKETVKSFLWEHTKVPKDIVERSGLSEWIRSGPHEDTRQAPIDPWPICKEADQIMLAVAGGAHPSNHFWFPADAPAVAARAIKLPEGWSQLIAEAEAELGSSEAACAM